MELNFGAVSLSTLLLVIGIIFLTGMALGFWVAYVLYKDIIRNLRRPRRPWHDQHIDYDGEEPYRGGNPFPYVLIFIVGIVGILIAKAAVDNPQIQQLFSKNEISIAPHSTSKDTMPPVPVVPERRNEEIYDPRFEQHPEIEKEVPMKPIKVSAADAYVIPIGKFSCEKSNGVMERYKNEGLPVGRVQHKGECRVYIGPFDRLEDAQDTQTGAELPGRIVRGREIGLE